MNKMSGVSRNDHPCAESPSEESLNAAIQGLPSIQTQIAERAYQIYLDAGLPEDVALEHWLAAENEARRWINSAINCTVQAANS